WLIMDFTPANYYDSNTKIWRGDQMKSYFDPRLSIGQIIFHEMRRHPQLIAQISATENTVLTFEEVLKNSIRVACYLRSLGLGQSDVVGIIARNTTHISAVAYACFFNGTAYHALSLTTDRSTIEKLYSITKPKVIFCDGDEFEKIRTSTSQLDVKIVTMRKHHPGSIPIEEVLKTAVEDNFLPVNLEQGNDQTLAIVCSSGTTGTPKPVTVSHRKQMSPLISRDRLTSADVQYTSSNLEWISGIMTVITSAVFSTTRIINDNAFDPNFVLKLIEKYKITWFICVTSTLAQLTNCAAFGTADLSSLRVLLYGGTRLSLEIQKRMRNRLSRDCLHFNYGLMELGRIGTVNLHFDKKPNSVGRLADGNELRIINKQKENLGPDQAGEVLIRNNEHWSGYYGSPELTHKIRDSEGWYHSSDLGYVDKDGFLYILDRMDDMLKYQTCMYYPNEIESIIAEMPQVAEVCVFGINDEINGDEAAATVVKTKGSRLCAQDVVDYVKSRTDSEYKHLNAGAIMVADLKRSTNGKTNRKANKEYFLNQIKVA
ncbi:hypothetical protein KR026_007106, partial [Drosophila bipectinata]